MYFFLESITVCFKRNLVLLKSALGSWKIAFYLQVSLEAAQKLQTKCNSFGGHLAENNVPLKSSITV